MDNFYGFQYEHLRQQATSMKKRYEDHIAGLRTEASAALSQLTQQQDMRLSNGAGQVNTDVAEVRSGDCLFIFA